MMMLNSIIVVIFELFSFKKHKRKLFHNEYEHEQFLNISLWIKCKNLEVLHRFNARIVKSKENIIKSKWIIIMKALVSIAYKSNHKLAKHQNLMGAIKVSQTFKIFNKLIYNDADIFSNVLLKLVRLICHISARARKSSRNYSKL